MHTKIKELLNAHEKDFPESRELNDLSMEDLLSLGKMRPSKPLAMNTSYVLDGHHHNRSSHGKNYDHLLRNEEKDAIDEEVIDLSELAAMIHDPEFIDDMTNHKPSENHQVAQEILHHYLDAHGAVDAHPHLEKELLDPLFNHLRDRLSEEGLIELLSEKMTHKTPHHPKDHSRMLKALILDTVYDGHQKENWKKSLLNIFNKRNGS